MPAPGRWSTMICAAEKLGGDAFALRDIEDDDAAATGGVALTADGDACLVGEVDEARGLAKGFGADGGDADLVDDLVAGSGGVEGGDVGGAVEKAEGIVGRSRLGRLRSRRARCAPASRWQRVERVGQRSRRT